MVKRFSFALLTKFFCLQATAINADELGRCKMAITGDDFIFFQDKDLQSLTFGTENSLRLVPIEKVTINLEKESFKIAFRPYADSREIIKVNNRTKKGFVRNIVAGFGRCWPGESEWCKIKVPYYDRYQDKLIDCNVKLPSIPD